MARLTESQWLVLDNLKNGWPYHTNLYRSVAEHAWIWCVSQDYIHNGQITDAGLGALLACPNPSKD